MERERRRMRALKKEHRKKELEEAKEDEKRKWLSFNSKAASRNLKVVKSHIYLLNTKTFSMIVGFFVHLANDIDWWVDEPFSDLSSLLLLIFGWGFAGFKAHYSFGFSSGWASLGYHIASKSFVTTRHFCVQVHAAWQHGFPFLKIVSCLVLSSFSATYDLRLPSFFSYFLSSMKNSYKIEH